MNPEENKKYLNKIREIFEKKGWKIFDYQSESWDSYLSGKSLLINSPTGTGKTYATWIGPLVEALQSKEKGIKIIWITPLRALAKDIVDKLQSIANEFNPDFKIELRTGDVSYAIKQKQLKNLPDCIITTPESMHLMFTNKNYSNYFKDLKCVVIDEWHELFGNKRGVQTELAVSRLKHIKPDLKLVAVSATIGNFEQATEVLFKGFPNHKIVQSTLSKKIVINTIYPDPIESYSWAGHMGTRLILEVCDIISQNKTTLIFTNTRAHTEIWYQKILEQNLFNPKEIAVHHGSLSQEERMFVEQNLNNSKFRAVICTSSLDLGVDFRNVDCIIQIGSPKSVNKFIQRAGRSGHSPYETSKIYFIPTHTLELLDAAALKQAIATKKFESIKIISKPLDVLIQYLITLATSDGFKSKVVFNEVKETFTYKDLTKKEWDWCLKFITNEETTLKAYKQYSKVKHKKDFYFADDKRIIRMHKISIGTINSELSISIKFSKGGHLGSVEEGFISKLKPRDVFWFSGKLLELVAVNGMTAIVKRSKSSIKAKTPVWTGGRLNLSSELAQIIKRQIDNFKKGEPVLEEISKLTPVLDLQQNLSYLPGFDEILIESFKTKYGFHYFIYTFEGRNVNEGIASLLAFRILKKMKITFSLAMNDYGFELLSDQDVNFSANDFKKLFSVTDLDKDLLESLNATELSKRKFRDIAKISGLVTSGYPGEKRSHRSLQISSELLFNVLSEFDKENLLIKQSYSEVLMDQLDERRIRAVLTEIKSKKIILKKVKKVTPFLLPILVDSLRSQMTSEKISEIAAKMINS